jgi:hypothetical protein
VVRSKKFHQKACKISEIILTFVDSAIFSRDKHTTRNAARTIRDENLWKTFGRFRASLTHIVPFKEDNQLMALMGAP